MWVKPLKEKLAETGLNRLILVVNESNCMPKKYGLIKEDNFTIILCKIGYMKMIF